jgi:hypothetical protein
MIVLVLGESGYWQSNSPQYKAHNGVFHGVVGW